MKTRLLTILAIAISVSANSLPQPTEEKEVEEVIISSYIKGLIDGENFQTARDGIHEDFVILGNRDSLLTQRTRDQWIDQRSSRGDLEKVKYSIQFIDISGEAASAKIEMTRGNIIATDYVFLYKFQDGWKIVSAIDDVKRR